MTTVSTPGAAPSPPPSRAPAARGVDEWPALGLGQWRETYRTIHLYSQIVGKIQLALTPRTNQWWNVPLYVTARGLTTSPMPCAGRTFEIELDFLGHELVVRDSEGRVRMLPFVPRTIADFYRELFALLGALGFEVAIRTVPCEIPHTVPFERDDTEGGYDAEAATRFFQVLRRIEPAFERFRARFRGKCSPIQFFWGTFDLAVTRFSGRRVPPRGGTMIERIAHDEEMISLGFWPGDAWGAYGDDGQTLEALFYSYAVPEPPGLAGARVLPEAAYYHPKLKEFVLAYDAVRQAGDPAAELLAFAQSTYDAASSLAFWPRETLAYP